MDVLAPAQSEGTRASLARWLTAVGDPVAEHEPLCELETDKVTVEVAAPAAGVIAELCVEAGADVEPGTVLARLAPIGATATASADSEFVIASAPSPRANVSQQPADGRTHAPAELRLSPAVRRALATRGLAADTIAGTGRGGRLTLADVERAPATDATSATKSTDARTVPHTPMRRRIAERMAASLATAPHVTAVFEADMTAVAAHRAAGRAAFEARGVPLTYTAYFVAACVAAMRAVPSVNAAWGPDALTLHADVNIGVGTALGESGLIVPVVHRAQTLSLEGIAARLADTTARARAGALTPADVANGTFTISNHGVSGSLLAAPIILVAPQVAILGVGKLEKRVVVRTVGGADAILIRPMAYVSLTIDHRALDGAATNAWLTAFVAALEGWPAP